jgi:hypothetical protein
MQMFAEDVHTCDFSGFMITFPLSVPKTSLSYDEVAAGHKTRRYVCSLGFRTGKMMPFHKVVCPLILGAMNFDNVLRGRAFVPSPAFLAFINRRNEV